MISTFKTATSGITAQPQTEKLIVRSTSAADSTQTLTASGTVSGPDTDVLTLLGQREVQGAKAFSALTAAILSAPCAGTVSVRGQGTKAEATHIITTNPANNDTAIVGLTGFTRTYTYKTTLTGAVNEILIGTLPSDTAVNYRRAIRAGDAVIGDGTGAGSLYGAGTMPNPHFTIIGISGTVLTAQDLIACNRQLAWSFTQTGTGMSLGTMLGGVDGQILVSIGIGATTKYNAFTLEDESLALHLLPPLTDWYSDWFSLNGKPATIYLDGENVTTPIAAAYQTTTDVLKANVRAGAVTISNVDNNSQITTMTEIAQFVRLRLTNTNTTASSVNAKIVSG